jgi:hypothetical protein
VSDVGLKTLTNLPLLTTLDLGVTKVTDAGLTSLTAFKDLSSLKLNGNKLRLFRDERIEVLKM